ncbi:lipoprotein [Flavivirga spongiicola]|uniref:Type IV secretion system putative lipoprotein virB7 n=1 Tax=Flavivirga spongiicola TaxID=421621 RepID=A0ABU7XPU8_9FLAO|nr:lipoprotein [Flavivirga sp. MEBiC05379]MDO5977794.1 hypothetical protein [Flavivirga sp. MEBiC05379]
MKKIINLFTITLLLTSCSNTDENNINSSLLFGLWEIDKVILNNGTNLALEECKLQETLYFTSGSTVQWHTPENDNMTNPCSFFDYNMMYILSGKKIIAKYKNTEIEINVSKIDDSIITIKQINLVTTFKK